MTDGEDDPAVGDGAFLDLVIKGLLADPRTAVALPNKSEDAVRESARPETPSIGEKVSAEDLLDRQTDREERSDLIKLRRKYAMRLLWFMGVQLVFMNTVLILSTKTHALLSVDGITLRYFLLGTFGEIVGVVTVTARFLFSNKPFLGKHE